MNITSIETEFDKRFTLQRDDYCGDWLRDKNTSKPAKLPQDIKQFYRSKITELLESTRLEKSKHDDFGKEHENFTMQGYNSAVSDQDKKRNEAIN